MEHEHDEHDDTRQDDIESLAYHARQEMNRQASMQRDLELLGISPRLATFREPEPMQVRDRWED